MAAALLRTPIVGNILLAEAAERFTYYSIRSSLLDLFTRSFKYNDAAAVAIVSFWSALCYISPIAGATLADGVLGRYTTILRGLLIYIASLAILSVGSSLESAPLCIAALIGVAFASGGIKPCVAPFGADQLPGGEEGGAEDARNEAVTSYYFFFYFSINVGSCIAYFVVSTEINALGFSGAYAICAGAVAVAMVLFVLPRGKYVKTPPTRSAVLAVVRVVYSAARAHSRATLRCCRGGRDEVRALIPEKAGGAVTWLDAARGAPGVLDSDVAEARSLGRLLPIFAALPFFWAVYDSYGTTWQLQARRMQLCIVSQLCIAPLQTGIVNALLVLLLIPVFDRVIVPALRRVAKRVPWLEPTPLARMSAGMFIAAGAFATSGLLEERINRVGDGVINVAEQLPQYFLLTVAEILVSTTGLEFAFVEAGPNLKSAVLALFFLTTAAGDLLNGALYSALGGFTAAKLIWIVTGLQVVAAACFVAVARAYVSRQTEELGVAEAARVQEGTEAAPSADVGDERDGDGATLSPSSG